jgi:hypothetical protein
MNAQDPSACIADVAESQLASRNSCRFDFLYKQHVAAEDLYLGMSGKTPSSVDCEALVVKVCALVSKLNPFGFKVCGLESCRLSFRERNSGI